jgi:hypothetical protein
MTNEERDLIAAFIARVAGVTPPGAGAGATGSPLGNPWAGASVPPTPPALPPVDPEADALIAGMFQRTPGAGYRMTQLAFVQEHALAAAQARIHALEAQLQAAQAAPHGGFLSGLFGGGRSAPPPQQMPPQMPPQIPLAQMAAPAGYGARPGMWQQSGPGFLGSALTTAAGVAGGMVMGNALMNLLSPGHGGFGASPWGNPAGDPGIAGVGGPESQTGWMGVDPSLDPSADPGVDPGGAVADDPSAGGWDAGGSDSGGGDGGWDQGGGSDDTLV